MRHRRHAVLARAPVPFEALRPVGAVRRVVAGAAGGHGPGVAMLAVDDDAHGLRRLVDAHDDGGCGLRGREEQAGEQGGQTRNRTHGIPLRRETDRRSLAGRRKVIPNLLPAVKADAGFTLRGCGRGSLRPGAVSSVPVPRCDGAAQRTGMVNDILPSVRSSPSRAAPRP